VEEEGWGLRGEEEGWVLRGQGKTRLLLLILLTPSYTEWFEVKFDYFSLLFYLL